MLAMPYRNGKRVRVRNTKNSNGDSVNRSAVGMVRAVKIEITSTNQRVDFSIRDGAFEHPETAIGMRVADAPGAKSLLGAFKRASHFVRCFNVVDFDVDHTDADPDP